MVVCRLRAYFRQQHGGAGKRRGFLCAVSICTHHVCEYLSPAGGGLLATGTIALTLQSCLMQVSMFPVVGQCSAQLLSHHLFYVVLQENEVTSSGNGGGFNPILPPPIVVPTPGATTQSGGYLVGGGAVLSMFSVAVTATNFTGNAVR